MAFTSTLVSRLHYQYNNDGSLDGYVMHSLAATNGTANFNQTCLYVKKKKKTVCEPTV